MFFRMTIELLEELLEYRPVYAGILGFFVWNIVGLVMFPYMAMMLLRNDNDTVIKELVLFFLEQEEPDE